MPRPANVERLPLLPGLPGTLHRLAEIYITKATSPDYLLLLAEACDELWPNLPLYKSTPVQLLAAELRRRAPGYA